jgi:hypothetical protein
LNFFAAGTVADYSIVIGNQPAISLNMSGHTNFTARATLPAFAVGETELVSVVPTSSAGNILLLSFLVTGVISNQQQLNNSIIISPPSGMIGTNFSISYNFSNAACTVVQSTADLVAPDGTSTNTTGVVNWSQVLNQFGNYSLTLIHTNAFGQWQTTQIIDVLATMIVNLTSVITFGLNGGQYNVTLTNASMTCPIVVPANLNTTVEMSVAMGIPIGYFMSSSAGQSWISSTGTTANGTFAYMDPDVFQVQSLELAVQGQADDVLNYTVSVIGAPILNSTLNSAVLLVPKEVNISTPFDIVIQNLTDTNGCVNGSLTLQIDAQSKSFNGLSLLSANWSGVVLTTVGYHNLTVTYTNQFGTIVDIIPVRNIQFLLYFLSIMSRCTDSGCGRLNRILHDIELPTQQRNSGQFEPDSGVSLRLFDSR